MNCQQKKAIIFGLSILAAILASMFIRIDWVREYADCLRIFAWDQRPLPLPYEGIDEYGLLVRMGAIGVILGVVLPSILLVGAIFLHLGDYTLQKRNIAGNRADKNIEPTRTERAA